MGCLLLVTKPRGWPQGAVYWADGNGPGRDTEPESPRVPSLPGLASARPRAVSLCLGRSGHRPSSQHMLRGQKAGQGGWEGHFLEQGPQETGPGRGPSLPYGGAGAGLLGSSGGCGCGCGGHLASQEIQSRLRGLASVGELPVTRVTQTQLRATYLITEDRKEPPAPIPTAPGWMGQAPGTS